MADHYMTPAAAQQQGSDLAQKQLEDFRKNAAYNALMGIYGPAAGDPQAWDQAQAASASQQKLPGELQAQTLTNDAQRLQNVDTSGEQQRMAAYRAAQMLKGSAGADGSVDPQAFDSVVAPNAGVLGIDPQHIAPLKSLLTQPGGVKHLDSISNALLGPTKVTGAAIPVQNADGSYSVVKTDQYGRSVQVPLNGGQPASAVQGQERISNQSFANQTRAQQGATRLGIAQQNADTGTYRAGVAGNNSAYGAPDGVNLPQQGGRATAGVTDPRVLDAIIAKSGSIDAAIAHAPNDATAQALADRYATTHGLPSGQSAARTPAATQIAANYFSRLPPKGRQMAVAQAQHLADQGTNLHNMNAIIDQVDKQITPYTAGAGSLVSALPGTVQKNLRANLDTLAAQGLTAWIQSLKNAQGQTGIGRVLQSEANAAMRIYGNMEQDQSAQQLAYHTRLFRTAVNQLYDHARAGFRTMYGTDPERALGLPAYQRGGAPAPAQYTKQQQAVLDKYGVH